MRWRFPHPSEDDRRREILARIDGWWAEFQRQVSNIVGFMKGSREWDLAEWQRRHLDPISPEIMWEYGPGLKGEWRLVLTPESDRHLRPLVETMLVRAPSIPDWEFYGFRLAESVEAAAGSVEARTGVDLAGFAATAAIGEEGLVDITFCPPRGLFRKKDRDFDAAFAATECLLGEQVLDEWIGAIVVEKHMGARPLAELRGRVTSLIEEIRKKRPTTPLHERASTGTWSLLKLEPTPAEDYGQQRDLFVAKAMDLDMWKAARSGRYFHSARFSGCGETFAYLKTDGSGDLPEDGFADKAEIEDAVDAALMPLKLGCFIGGGTGLRYSYVDLALTDVGKAVDVLLPVLRQGKLPRRSWILFFDDVMRDEYIPIWDDSPPPPR